MERIQSYVQLQQGIQKYPVVLVYVSSADCSVCYADYIKITQMCEKMQYPSLTFDVNDVPEAAGQLNLFSLPAVVLYYQGKEYHRQARIIDFHALEERMILLQQASLEAR